MPIEIKKPTRRLERAFGEPGLHRVEANIQPDNERWALLAEEWRKATPHP